MITIEQQAQLVQDRINAIALELGLDFFVKVTPTEGEFVERCDYTVGGVSHTKRAINAIFIAQPSVVIPLEKLNSYTTTNILRIAVKTIVEDDKAEMDLLLNTLVGGTSTNSGLRGVPATLTDADNTAYSCVTNCNMASSGDAQILPTIGECVIFEMMIYFFIVEGGFLSNGTYFKLQCRSTDALEQIVDLESSWARVRITDTVNVQNITEMQSVVGQQGMTVTINMPYLSGDAYKRLANDIIKGDLDVVYKMQYFDSNLESDVNNVSVPVDTWYVVLKEGSITRQAGKIIALNAVFVIARSDVYATQIAEY